MKSIENVAVAKVFASYPPVMRRKLLALRTLIFQTAATTEGVGSIEETLKWGEPAYLAKYGSTIRIAWKKSQPTKYAIYFNCKTTLIETFKTLFPSEFSYEGNRAIVFDEADVVANVALAFCMAAALTYHRKLPVIRQTPLK